MLRLLKAFQAGGKNLFMCLNEEKRRCKNCGFWNRRNSRGIPPKYHNQGLCAERTDVIASWEDEGETCIFHRFEHEIEKEKEDEK